MNDEGRRHSAPAHSYTTGPDDTLDGRPRPELVIRVPLESWARIHWGTGSFEDERRLALWLCRSRALPELVLYLQALVEWLEAEEAEAA